MNTTTNNNTKTITSTSELNQFILHKYQTEFNFDRQLLEKLKPYIKYTLQNSPLDISSTINDCYQWVSILWNTPYLENIYILTFYIYSCFEFGIIID